MHTATANNAAPAILNYSSRGQRLNWFGPFTLLAAFLLLHFSISVGIWLSFFAGMARNPYMRAQVLRDILSSFTYFAPAVILFIASAWTFYLAIRRRRVGLRILFILLAGAAFFCIDVKFYRYQISIDVASREYWDSGGRAREYFTWWWLNDRWLRRF